MSRRTRIRLLFAATLSATVASVPADGPHGILLALLGAACGLATLLTIKGSAR